MKFEPKSMRALLMGFGFLLGCLTVQPALAVSDDAVLYISSLEVTAAGAYGRQPPLPVEFVLWIRPTADAPAGNITANIDIDVSTLNGTGTVQKFHQSWTVSVPDQVSSYHAEKPLEINWNSPPGVFLVTAKLTPLGEPNRVWDTKVKSYTSGSNSDLMSGWGSHEYNGIARVDFDNDGVIDLTLQNHTDGSSVQWNVVAMTGTGIHRDQQPYRTFWF